MINKYDEIIRIAYLYGEIKGYTYSTEFFNIALDNNRQVVYGKIEDKLYVQTGHNVVVS